MVIYLNVLGKSTKAGNKGINDLGDINPRKALKSSFSNLQEYKKIVSQYPL